MCVCVRERDSDRDGDRETATERERKSKTFLYTFTLWALQAGSSKTNQTEIVLIPIKEGSCLNPFVPKTS